MERIAAVARVSRGDGAMTRALIVSRGARYAALAVFAAGLLLGASKSNSGDSVHKIVGWALGPGIRRRCP